MRLSQHALDVAGYLGGCSRYITELEAFDLTVPSAAIILDLLPRGGMYRKSMGCYRNGNIIVAIVRDGLVTTIMPRRDDQRWTLESLRVETIFSLYRKEQDA